MRAQKPTMGERRTLYGKETLTGADHPKAPPGRGHARLWLHRARGGQGYGHKRAHLPPLEKPLWGDELPRGQAPQGGRKGECSPKEVACREGAGHRPPKGGKSGKLLSPAR